MATGTLLFDTGGALAADGTGTINNPPIPAVVVSTGTQPSNAPKVTIAEWQFDAATDNHVFFAFRMPENYASGGTLKLQYEVKSVQSGTNTVVWKAALAKVTPGSARIDNAVFPVPDNASSVLANNEAAGTVKELSIALSGTALNGVVAGDLVVLFIGRDADSGSDTATGLMGLLAASLEYVTT